VLSQTGLLCRFDPKQLIVCFPFYIVNFGSVVWDVDCIRVLIAVCISCAIPDGCVSVPLH